MKSKLLYYFYILIVTGTIGSCTELDENPYNTLVKSNYFQTKEDVIRATFRTYEHAHSSIAVTYELQEDSSDEMMTPNRQGHWLDGQYYYRLHYHTWTPQDRFANDIWNSMYQGIAQANNSMEDLQTIDAANFGMTEAEIRQFIAELRVFRAWYHLRLFNYYRNIVISTKYADAEQLPLQSSPQETFDFIERELMEAAADLPKKGDPGTENYEGRWTKAGAMSLLVRLYLNAQVWTGEDKFTECAAVAQDIINGEFGDYSIESRWDAPFDYNNHNSSETIFAFPARLAFAQYHYSNSMYFVSIGWNNMQYFQITGQGLGNFKYALQPGRNVDGSEYPFALGKPFIKFQKYPDDVRLKLYKNLGNSEREGMFLYGYLHNPETGARIIGTKGYEYYIRDQVGIFNRRVGEDLVSYGPDEVPDDKQSDMTHADENSGIYVIKYPLYPSSDPNSLESDFVEIRLAEIYYSLAECRFREGDTEEASELLNTVRQRYYPEGSPSLYSPDGSDLTEQELLDEWGREFVAEGRRRTDLVRFDKFSKGTWWDKQPDQGDHTNIIPIGQNVLGASPQLIQNPGY
ncbi:MAG: RagB/SusD family nutrient uptake outer membrane protein [Anditalea sp.]